MPIWIKPFPAPRKGDFANSSQVCYAGTRILVQCPIVNEALDRLAAFVGTLRLGSSLDPQSQIGPVISGRQRDGILAVVARGTSKGARLAAGGVADLGPSYFVPPTILADVDMSMSVAREEISSPAAVVIPFDTLEEAIHIGNQTEYGLAGAVWSQNISSALKVVNGIHSGTMWVNCYGMIDPLAGFHGAKMSGYGAKGTHAHLDTDLYTKSVYISL